MLRLIRFVDQPAAADAGEGERQAGLEGREAAVDRVFPLAGLELAFVAADLVEVSVADRDVPGLGLDEEEVEGLGWAIGIGQVVPDLPDLAGAVRRLEVGVEDGGQLVGAFFGPAGEEDHACRPVFRGGGHQLVVAPLADPDKEPIDRFGC